MSERKMATIRKISAIESIPEADRICTYVIDGWKVVDSIGKYSVGDLCMAWEVRTYTPWEGEKIIFEDEGWCKAIHRVEYE